MKPDARRKIVADSIESGDMQILSALLPAHPLTTGLTKAEVEIFTRRYREKTQPDLARRLSVMRKAQEILHERAGLVMTHAEKLIGADRKRVAALRDADTKFTKALAG